MGLIGKVTGSEAKTNRDGKTNKLMLQVEITDPDDIQTVELMTQAGEDTNPPNDSKVLILSVGDAYKIGVAVDDGIVPSMEQCEKKLYISDVGTIKAFINLLSDGNIELNGNGESAVRFAALEFAFNNLLSDFNNHVHPGVTAGGTSTLITATPSFADISPAEVTKVRLP